MNSFFGWIRQWAATAYQASTDVAFYRRVGERKTGVALGHLAMLAVLWTLPVSVLFFIGLRQVSVRVSEGLRSDIPAGTVFEMKDGRLSNNLAEPLVFRQKDATVIVNTASSTLALAEGEDGLVIGAVGIFQRDHGREENVDFKDVPAFRVDRERLLEDIARWAPLALFIGSLFAMVFMFLAFWSGIIMNALLHGFALWLLLKLVKRQRRWREAFVAAAYAATASVVLRLAVQGFAPLAALPDLLYWAFIAWIVYDAYKGGAHERKQEAADRPRAEGESGPV